MLQLYNFNYASNFRYFCIFACNWLWAINNFISSGQCQNSNWIQYLICTQVNEVGPGSYSTRNDKVKEQLIGVWRSYSIVYGNKKLLDTLLHMGNIVIGLLEIYVVSVLNVIFWVLTAGLSYAYTLCRHLWINLKSTSSDIGSSVAAVIWAMITCRFH